MCQIEITVFRPNYLYKIKAVFRLWQTKVLWKPFTLQNIFVPLFLLAVATFFCLSLRCRKASLEPFSLNNKFKNT